MANINEYFPVEVLHPGETLNEKLEEMGMSRKEFAVRTGKPEKTIIAVLNGESSITPEMAVLFENVTRIPAHFWMNKQMHYNEYKARLKRREDVEAAADWCKAFPYNEMAKLGWVPPVRKTEERTIELFEYFRVSTHNAWNRLYLESELKVAAYTSLAHTNEPYAIAAWLRRGELQAGEIQAPEFNRSRFRSVLPEIKVLMATQPTDFFRRLQHLCLLAGVKVFYTPKLPGAPLSGSTRWLGDTPVIQLTARYKQNDRFWFTFFHEAGHIILHGKKYISLEGIDFAGADPVREQEAHDFAEEWTFSKAQEAEVLSSVHYDEPMEIIAFAEKFGTHPALIIGRLQHLELIPFSLGREYIEPIDLEKFGT